MTTDAVHGWCPQCEALRVVTDVVEATNFAERTMRVTFMCGHARTSALPLQSQQVTARGRFVFPGDDEHEE